MGVAVAVPVFAVGVVTTLVAAATFARRLDRLGARFGMPEVWIGLLTAVAADGPEISSALAALIKGSHAAGVGVMVGSNTFNMAAMVGGSALLTGCVRVPRRTLALEGAVALAVSATVIALLLGWLPVAAAVPLLACVVTAYLVLVLRGYASEHAIAEPDPRGHRPVEFATHRQLALMGLDLAAIVGGSFLMVESALSLGRHWGVAAAVVGALVLGPLTSLPNALTGIRLGLGGRGSALVTEAMGSNTINLVAGIALPSIFVTLSAHGSRDRLDLALLAATMVATVALLAARGGMRRAGAAVVLALYAAFVVVTLS